MRSTPPAGRIGGIASVGRPGICLIFFQPVEGSHILRVSHGLEHAHILSAGKHVGPVEGRVNPHDHPGHKLVLIHLPAGQHGAERRHKVAPDQRFLCNRRKFPGRNRLRTDNFQRGTEPGFTRCPGRVAVIENVQGKEIFVLRVDTVTGKPAAQPVGAFVHGAHGLDNARAAHAFAGFRDDGGNGAPGGNTDFPFPPSSAAALTLCPWIHKLPLFSRFLTIETQKRTKAPRRGVSLRQRTPLSLQYSILHRERFCQISLSTK